MFNERVLSQVLYMQVDVTCIEDVQSLVMGWAQSGESARYVCVSNVHMCMECFDDDNFCDVINNADLVVPDGKPLVWAQQVLGVSAPQQVRGMDLMLALCELAGNRGTSIGLYGGSVEVLQLLEGTLMQRYPELDIGFSASPPFRPLNSQEDAEYIAKINDSGVKILFVGIGCPKQERWMAEHRESLDCVMIGVGAAFDFIAGKKRHAPKWMQTVGLEWLFRLICEPRRLWLRYLKQNPRFIWYFSKQLLANFIRSKSETSR